MFKKLHYFEDQFPRGFSALFSGLMIQSIADGFVGIFLPIFLFTKLGYKVHYVLLYFALSWLLYALLVPLGAQFLNRFGLKRALKFSVVVDALFLVCLYYVDRAPAFFLISSIILRMLNLLMFWIPYHIDFAKFTSRGDRGREYSAINASAMVISIILPFISGFLISRFGFGSVFALGVFFTFVVYIPFSRLPRTHEKFSWSYAETYRHFWSKKNQKLVLAHMASGAENIVSTLIWPIFIWLILKGEYWQVGAISTLISAATIILQLLAGRWTDKFDKRKLLKLGSFFYALGWLVKAAIATAFQIFVVGVYHTFSAIIMRTPFDSLTYEIAADLGHYVDEFTVVKEMAVQFGRILMIVLLTVMLIFASIQWTFLLAALTSLAFNLIPEASNLLDIRQRMVPDDEQQLVTAKV